MSDAEQLAGANDGAGALAEYRLATDVMHNSLLPSAATLDAINLRALDATYASSKSTSSTDEVLLLVAGAATVAVLCFGQLYLFRRTRRVLNPALLAAAVLVVVLTAAGVSTLGRERHDLKGAKQDAFDSVVALSQARSVAYDANADESRYLIDPGRAASYQQQFLLKSLQITDLGAATTIADFDATLAPKVAAAETGRVEFGGSLGAELDNITFPGERQAALATLVAFAAYQRDDRVLRQLATSGERDASIRYDTGTAADQSDGAFVVFDTALQKVLGINTTYFARYVAHSDHDLSGWGTLPGAGILVVVALAVIGFWPRINEYRI